MPARIERIMFPGSSGDELAARLDLPAGPPLAYALFAHCFTCSKDVLAASRIATALTEAGFGVLRFDFTGLGQSGGEFANTDFTSNIDDIVAAADWLREHRRAPQLLIGHSLGGAAVIAVADDIDEVRAVATIGAPAHPAHVADLFSDAIDTIAEHGHAEVQLAGRTFTIRQSFVDDLRSNMILDRAAASRKALLVLHAPSDQIVGIDNAREIFEAARHPKSFVSLDGADHLLTDAADAVFASNVIAAFATRYVVDERGGLAAPKPSAPVVVAETTQGPFLNHVVVGRHRLLADEPESVGGFDAGPSPYDLLGAALGACTSMTMRMYADRKHLPLGRVTVEVSHAKVHAQDSADLVEMAEMGALADPAATGEMAENAPSVARDGGAGGVRSGVPGRMAMIDRFDRVITIDGDDLTDDDRAKLLMIADKCPVHRTLEASSVIATVLSR